MQVLVDSNPTSAIALNNVPSSSGEDACPTRRRPQVRVLPGRLSLRYFFTVRRCYGRHASLVGRWSGFESRVDLVPDE
jgi:hypothetical protein